MAGRSILALVGLGLLVGCGTDEAKRNVEFACSTVDRSIPGGEDIDSLTGLDLALAFARDAAELDARWDGLAVAINELGAELAAADGDPSAVDGGPNHGAVLRECQG